MPHYPRWWPSWGCTHSVIRLCQGTPILVKSIKVWKTCLIWATLRLAKVFLDHPSEPSSAVLTNCCIFLSQCGASGHFSVNFLLAKLYFKVFLTGITTWSFTFGQTCFSTVSCFSLCPCLLRFAPLLPFVISMLVTCHCLTKLPQM